MDMAVEVGEEAEEGVEGTEMEAERDRTEEEAREDTTPSLTRTEMDNGIVLLHIWRDVRSVCGTHDTEP